MALITAASLAEGVKHAVGKLAAQRVLICVVRVVLRLAQRLRPIGIAVVAGVGMDPDKHVRPGLVRNLRPLAVTQINIVRVADHDHLVAALKQDFLNLLRHDQVQFILRNPRIMARCARAAFGLQRRRTRPVRLPVAVALALMPRVDDNQPAVAGLLLIVRRGRRLLRRLRRCCGFRRRCGRWFLCGFRR